MANVGDNLTNLADRVAVYAIVQVGRAGIPRRFVVDQHVDLAGGRRLFNRMGVFGADRQRLFHQDGHAAPRASFHHGSMVERIGVGQHGLRMSFVEHILKPREQQLSIQLLSLRRH
jgi:hypothetical protein